MKEVPLGAGREFDLIRVMRARWGALAVGIGDDAAALEVPRGEQLVVTTDAAIEGTHFDRAWLRLDEIAYRATTAALSDLAAMAARPLGILVALELPADGNGDAERLADGIGAACRTAGTVIRGGNIATGGRLSITTTALGSAFTPLLRSGARAGDRVYVTGRRGGPAAAVRAFRAGVDPAPAVRDRFARPTARLAEARWLATRGASAAIDISDGIGGDAAHLAAASGTAVEIDLDLVPALDGAEREDVTGGEEYELLVTAAGELPADAFEQAFGIPLTPIGQVASGSAEARFTRGGRRVATPRGHDHLSR